MEEKKKSGTLKKIIIIAILAVVIIAAVVIGILLATGKLKLNFTDKSKMVAGVEKLGETLTDPLDRISDAAEKNGTKVKILENLKSDSAVEASTEISANIDELSSPKFSSSNKSTIKTVTDIINDSKIGFNFRFDGNKSLYAKVEEKIDSASVSGEAVYDGKQVGVRSEDLNSKWLTISSDDIDDIMKENGLKLDNAGDKLTEAINQAEKVTSSVNIDKKKRDKIEKRYQDVLKKYVSDKSKDIKKENAKVTVDGKEKSCSKLTLELDDEDFKDLLKTYLKEFSKDEDIKQILTDVFDAYAEMMKEAGQEKVAKQMTASLSLVYDNIDSVIDQIDEIEFEGKVKLIVYATTTNTYRTDVILETNGTTIKLETTFNKKTTVINISIGAQGMNIKVGTITITSTDDTFGIKFEANKALMDLANLSGNEYYFDFKYKISKSKSELTFEGKAGDYGYAKISTVTDISTNTNSEYADTTTLSIDIDAPEYVTAKMQLTMKTNIKLGNVSIPSIKDSVDMTDEAELKEYQEEIQENAKDLLDKFSEVKSLKPILENVLDERM